MKYGQIITFAKKTRAKIHLLCSNIFKSVLRTVANQISDVELHVH